MSWAVRRQSFSSLRSRPRSCERESKIKLAHVVLKVIYFDRRDAIDSGGGAGDMGVHQNLFFFSCESRMYIQWSYDTDVTMKSPSLSVSVSRNRIQERQAHSREMWEYVCGLSLSTMGPSRLRENDSWYELVFSARRK